ncbi:unnamed protein product, partial [Brassica rapa subsp. trilocularis]
MKLVAEKTRNPRRRRQCLRADLASIRSRQTKLMETKKSWILY